MRTILPLALCLAFATPAVPAATVLELDDLRLIDGTGAPARHVDRLVVSDGRIVAIDGEGSVPAMAANDRWQRVALGGATVMPGLIDTHVHVARFPNTRAK